VVPKLRRPNHPFVGRRSGIYPRNQQFSDRLLGEQFEKIERQTFGGDGFDIYVEKVAAVEKQLGIYDLAQFTPR
jgi:hypothetical protein